MTQSFAMALRVAARFERLADQGPGARKNVKDLVKPINAPKGMDRSTVKESVHTDVPRSESTDPDRRDLRPQDVFQPKIKNMNVVDLAHKGWPGVSDDYSDMERAIRKQIPKDKGYATVKNLSQYLVETGGGGGTPAVGKTAAAADDELERVEAELQDVQHRYDALNRKYKQVAALARRKKDMASEQARMTAEAAKNEVAREWKRLDDERKKLVKQQSKLKPTATHYSDGRLIPKPGDKVYQTVSGFGGMPATLFGLVSPSGKTVKITGTGSLLGETSRSKSYPMSPHWTVVDDPAVKRQLDERKQREMEEEALKARYAAAKQEVIALEARRLGVHKIRGPHDIAPGDTAYAIGAYDPDFDPERMDPVGLQPSVQSVVVKTIKGKYFLYENEFGNELTSGNLDLWWVK